MYLGNSVVCFTSNVEVCDLSRALGKPMVAGGIFIQRKKRLPWLFRVYVGEYTTQLCWDYNNPDAPCMEYLPTFTINWNQM